jgi:hypothetical protein
MLATLLATAGLSAQTGLSFLKLGVGARAIGMGEAYSAAATDPSAMYYNPAGMTRSHLPQILLMHKEWIQGVTTEYLGAATALNSLRLGVSINATTVGDIEIRTTPGPAIGTFSARNAAIGFSASYDLSDELAIGATGKYLYEKILVAEASGLGLDFGASYRTPWNLRLAAAYLNLGSLGVLGEESSTLPKMFRAGGAYDLNLEGITSTVTLASDLVSLSGEGRTHLHLGAEIEYRRVAALRLGYQTGYEGKAFSTGIGLRYGMFNFDYAFVPFRYDLGTTHTVSLSMEFQ